MESAAYVVVIVIGQMHIDEPSQSMVKNSENRDKSCRIIETLDRIRDICKTYIFTIVSRTTVVFRIYRIIFANHIKVYSDS